MIKIKWFINIIKVIFHILFKKNSCKNRFLEILNDLIIKNEKDYKKNNFVIYILIVNIYF